MSDQVCEMRPLDKAMYRMYQKQFGVSTYASLIGELKWFKEMYDHTPPGDPSFVMLFNNVRDFSKYASFQYFHEHPERLGLDMVVSLDPYQPGLKRQSASMVDIIRMLRELGDMVKADNYPIQKLPTVRVGHGFAFKTRSCREEALPFLKEYHLSHQDVAPGVLDLFKGPT